MFAIKSDLFFKNWLFYYTHFTGIVNNTEDIPRYYDKDFHLNCTKYFLTPTWVGSYWN